ncbi:MAG: TraB/GumN family protein, partial [Methanocorpusculum sp.]|nr:TraB/GumN family protein [Methanocorpusculum sp.]
MTQIHIVGTAHVSEKSIREVLETVERVNPEIIAIELDPGRYAALKQQMKEEDEAKMAAEEAQQAAESAAELSAESSSFVSTKNSEYVQSAVTSDVSETASAEPQVPFAKAESIPAQEKKAP